MSAIALNYSSVNYNERDIQLATKGLEEFAVLRNVACVGDQIVDGSLGEFCSLSSGILKADVNECPRIPEYLPDPVECSP